MKKPIKPEKKIALRYSATFPFDHVSNKVPLSYFNSWVDDMVPEGAKDITIGLKHEYEPDNCYWMASYLEISWEMLTINPDYDKQIKKYQAKLKKWEKKTNE